MARLHPCFGSEFYRSAVAVIAACVSLLLHPSGAAAATESDSPANRPAAELSEAARTALLDIDHLLASGDWSDATTAIARLLDTSAPGSFDQAMAHLHRAQLQLSRSDATPADRAAAIASLELAIRSGFWNRATTLEWEYILAQLYAQDHRLADAERTLTAWLAATPAPTPENYVLLVSVALERATQDSDRTDPADLERTLAFADAGLRLGVRPDPSLVLLKAACLHQLERWDEAAELLEFALDAQPAQPERWEQLYSLYAAGGRDLRALLTIERARQHGALDSAAADLTRGQLYYALDRLPEAVTALETGLGRGVSEPAPHLLFAAQLAYRIQELDRAERLLAAAEPVLSTDAQRRECAGLRSAIAAAGGR